MDARRWRSFAGALTKTGFTLRSTSERMDQRGLFWPDVVAVIGEAKAIRSGGVDRFDRPKWIIVGEVADMGEIEIVCAIEYASGDDETEFITLYWES